MKLPLLLSVPHGGVNVPPEVRDYCILTEEEIIVDGDEGASEIYWPLEEHVAAFIKTDIARAILDMNRRE
ncbi:MAG: N-formylglutamate amidohydrolase, partial [bacterium]|nr:N-formylglutamate amidohydrolase [bacterium]